MRTTFVALAAVLGLAAGGLGACTKAEQQDTASDIDAAGRRIGAEARDAANSPEVKKAGSELKEAAGDVGHVLKEGAKGAVQGAREGAAEVKSETKDADRDPPPADRR